MPKTEILKDGAEITIRPLTQGDLDLLAKFFLDLPPEDRKYLRIDVTNRKTVEQRLRLMDFGYHHRLVAIHGGEIIAEAALELPFEDWRQHQGEIRVIVSRPFQRRGLGMIMMREIYCLALRKDVDTVVSWMMKPQEAALAHARKMGFHDQSVLPSYVRDQDGEMQDLIILKAKIKDLLKEIEKFFGTIDWQACP
ncbi:MAG: GNAT family N-acetyltransferase [Candidatus Aminicenantes bacterium]|nr:GNAT family N-acetyltransferase [Candidatus Aminicenantes bacterium]